MFQHWQYTFHCFLLRTLFIFQFLWNETILFTFPLVCFLVCDRFELKCFIYFYLLQGKFINPINNNISMLFYSLPAISENNMLHDKFKYCSFWLLPHWLLVYYGISKWRVSWNAGREHNLGISLPQYIFHCKAKCYRGKRLIVGSRATYCSILNYTRFK